MEHEIPLITVIVPVYNISSYIGECIESIQKQTYKNLEMIIIDDGSDDDSFELCERLAAGDSRIRLIHQENMGVVAARGRGVEEASGTYISFVDGDDWIEPGMMERMLEEIGQADLITTRVRKELTPGKWIEESDQFPVGIYSGEDVCSLILRKMIYDADRESIQPFTPGMCNKLYLSSLVKKIYNSIDPKITYAEDAVFLYKYLLVCHSIVVSDQSFYHYRYREGSAVHKINSHMLMDINRAYLSLEADFRKHKLKDSLLFQLQKWVLSISCRAMNDYMGFDQRINIPEFIVDPFGLENKRVILYGAGKVGKTAYAQFEKFRFPIILWVDKNYKDYQNLNMPVMPPDEIFGREYDLIYIAVSDQTLAEKIKKELSEKGIPDNKLVWKRPIHVF